MKHNNLPSLRREREMHALIASKDARRAKNEQQLKLDVSEQLAIVPPSEWSRL